MKTDIGNDQTMTEFYEVPLGVCFQVYAEGLIKHYNSTIQSPFDMPRTLLEAKEATEKDYLNTLGTHKVNYYNLENCWVSPYAQVFQVSPEGHDDFMYDLMDRDYYKDKDFKTMESAGWVRISTSRLSGMTYMQSLKKLTGKQKVVIEKILLLNHENFFPKGEGDVIDCRECMFYYENGKIRTRTINR